MPALPLTDALREDYNALFVAMTVRGSRRNSVTTVVRKILQNRVRYQAVETQVGVPWFFVGIVHSLECSSRFDQHLHNGDPLTRKTTRVPRGRPRTGAAPFTWEQSAKDALELKSLHEWTDWSLSGIAYQLERYNGFGYRRNHPHVKSPYLWSFSNIYTRGKYIRDGVFSDTAVSEQCGAMVVLGGIMELDSAVRDRVAIAPRQHENEDDDTRPTPPLDEGEQDWPEDPPIFPNTYLHTGMENDPNVKLFQERLTELGFSLGVADGDFGAVTEAAVRLFQARAATPDGEPVEIDGVVGPDTWAALFGPESLPDRTGPGVASDHAKVVLEVAADEVGVRESPLGSNRGRRVEEYQSSVDPALAGQAWCMCFVYWCFKQAAARGGFENRVPKTGGVHFAWRKSGDLPNGVKVVKAADAQRNPNLIEPGMVFYIRTSDTSGHCGIVVESVNGRLETIEGNTNNGGSREGIGVFRRTRRTIASINFGFVRYW
jgi:lysozyme family protein